MNHCFTVDLNKETTPFPHYWEECVGSCHATTALRQDWRIQLKKCHDELGFRSVRFHGILNDDMSVCVREKEDSPLVYSFYNIDYIFDFLLDIGMKPFIELSFMPEAIASGNKTFFHYKGNITPPADYSQWANLVEALTRHLVERYGIEEVRSWYFEVWNEPNLINFFWTGTKEQYFELYKHAALAIKKVDAEIPVGGPSSAHGEWISDIIHFSQANSVPLDFISTHDYPTATALGQGMDMEQRMARAKRGLLTDLALKAKEEAGDHPLFYTEWNTSPGCRNPYQDSSYSAAFIIKTLFDNAGIVDLYSFWAFTDIFEELYFSSLAFHGGFGLLNIHGIPKPSYRAFEMMHKAGFERIPVELMADNMGVIDSTVEVAAVKGDSEVMIFAYNHNVPLATIKNEDIKITVNTNGISFSDTEIVKIDENHSNPKKVWLEIGKPEYLNKATIDILNKESEIKREKVNYIKDGSNIIFNLTVPPHGVACIVLKSL